jgi:lysophospholipase L1-like esterase
VIGSYVAVGDSFTEGVGDPGPDGAFVGWADRFAVLLADRRPEGDFDYTNLAVRGKLLDQIVEAATTSSDPEPTPTRLPSASSGRSSGSPPPSAPSW